MPKTEGGNFATGNTVISFDDTNCIAVVLLVSLEV